MPQQARAVASQLGVSRLSQTAREAPTASSEIELNRRESSGAGAARASNCIQILLVEDNPGDARLTREVFNEGKVANQIHVVTDGVQALEYLRREGRFESAPRPDLILLDLNLPRKDGREVLAEIKADPDLKSIPVVVLTTSAASQDIDQTYKLHANSFITKPVDLDQFITVVRSIENFWLTIVRLPAERP